MIFITNESESWVKYFNCNAVFGGGGYMEQDKAHTPPPPPPPPVNHGQVYKLVLEIYIENLFKNLYLWKF